MGILDNQQQENQQPLLPTPTLQPPKPNGPSQDFFWFRLDNSDIIEEIEHQLKGEVFVQDGKGGGMWDEKFSRDLSDEGIADILGIIYSFGINKNTILGCLTHEEIYQRCNSIWKELAKYFVVNKKRSGISNERRSILLKKIVYIVHSSLSRSEGGKESEQLSTASQRVEHLLRQDNQKPESSNPLTGIFNRR